MAAITPGKRAPHYQWGQQSVLCLRWGDNTLTPNSVNQPLGFLSNGKDSQIKSSMFCMPVTVFHTGGSGSPSKANTGADGVVYSALHFVWWVHVLFWLRDHLLCVVVDHLFWTLLFRSCVEGGGICSFYRHFIRQIQRQHTSVKLLITPVEQLCHSWGPPWP